MPEVLTRKEAIEYCNVDPKAFDNYIKFSVEITGFKRSRRWYFTKEELDRWKENRDKRIVILTLDEYEKCFEFAIKMVYGGSSLHGMRGQRTEVQAADNWISGILVEHALKKFLKEKFDFEIMLDEEVHPGEITAQDIIGVIEEGKQRVPKKFVGVKGSKWKSCFLIADEHGISGRSADTYVFGRIGLPSDHLFRILREHSFFKRVKDFLEKHENFRKIGGLNEVPIWLCGYVPADDLDYVTEIPGQNFGEDKDKNKIRKYVKNVAEMKNSDEDWLELIKII